MEQDAPVNNPYPDWRKMRRKLRRQASSGNSVADRLLLDLEACDLAEDPEKARRELWTRWSETFDLLAEWCRRFYEELQCQDQ